jgi:chemotaxis response regulator CheB
VDERRILYMGPTHGGAIAIDELQQLSLRRMEDGSAAWVLVDGTTLLVIPTEARGAEALFDAFTALPGLSAHAILAARDMPQSGTTRLWNRAQNRIGTGP